MKFAENLAALIKVKTLVTLSVIGTFMILALRGSVGSDDVMLVTTSVIAFYFGAVAEKRDKEKKHEEN